MFAANTAQQKAVISSDGPVLITAGPGTGKTFTIVQRTLHLIEQRGVAPENILIATFTDKAAKELLTRISNELSQRNITANINDMYVGTFHSICLRILKEYLSCTNLRKNYRILDAFDQQYAVFQNFHVFSRLEGSDSLFTKQSQWNTSGRICFYVNKLTEELITPDMLINDNDNNISALGQVLKSYRDLAAKNNFLDFSSILAETYTLLTSHPDVLNELRGKISHIMVDEYQDTNTIQEQIVLLIAGEKENICVVGDDDQALYRFRGAEIRNILEFPDKFSRKKCKVIPLVENYRSHSGIIDFYNKWMSTTSGKDFKFCWDKFRYAKTISPAVSSHTTTPSVFKLSGNYNREWHENILHFIQALRASGKLTDYNQIAFLFRSVKSPNAAALANFLEANGINVYSPRSGLFFQRRKIRLAIGCLMLMFPNYVRPLEDDQFTFLSDELRKYYKDCAEFAKKTILQPENKDMRRFTASTGKNHLTLTGTTDYAYSGLLYQLFAFKPFAEILDTETNAGTADTRPSRNLAKLTQIIGKFEYSHNVDTLNAKYIDRTTERLFNTYIRLLYDEGMNEYEDDSEYAPSGCVSFMTIHQAKGMEFPIVFVDSLHSSPRKQNDPLMSAIEEKFSCRPEFEPRDEIKYFDFWRLYYTAFSRAQNLLILTCPEDKISKYFTDIYSTLPSIDSACLDAFTFAQVKDVNIKNTYSFTSHITVYETCPRQYKFYRELEFMPARENAMLFGMLVHETIEDIHRAVLRNESDTVNDRNIESWLMANYDSLSRSTRSYLSKRQIQTALRHVMGYTEHQQGRWDAIQQAECDVSLAQNDYIIGGKIDLIRGRDDTIEIVDFKSTRKPDINDPESQKQLELYRRQLHIYAYLVEQRTGQKVSRMNLYYTGEFDSVPVISYRYSPTAIQGTMAAFDDTVRHIMSKDFRRGAEDDKICRNCDFRHYCRANNDRR